MNENEDGRGAKNKKKSNMNRKSKSGGFQSMGFAWQILKSILNSGYRLPTPIQRKAIPEILLGKDVVAMARTGSGKTAAFLLPMLQRLQERENSSKTSTNKGPRALVMSPTRELALQTFKFTKQFAKYTDFKAAVILGGDKIEDQFETMHQNPDIIIATPGRFLHLCVEMNLKLNSIEYVVFDEADRLFEMGFKEQLNEILHKLPTENRQTLLFSATLPQSLVEFARAGLQNPILIRLDTESKLSDKLKLAFFQCRIEDKLAILIYLLNNIIKAVKKPNDHSNLAIEDEGKKRLEQTLIFVATKHHVEFLKALLEELGYQVSYVYSSLDQTARQINIAKFQTKRTSIMIVTDVAARGIDIPMLDHVINFNFPAKAKLFVHRVGRVARAGQHGNAYSLVTNDELPYMHELYEFLSKQIRFATDDMDSEDWDEVYGSVPQSVVDVEKDSLKNLINSKIELAMALEVQENGYKQYLKSRPLASSFSVRAAKNIRLLHPLLPFHPLLRISGESNSNIRSEIELLDKLKNYSTKATIFEINKTSSKTASAQVMKKKRNQHDKIVEKFRARETTEEDVPLFQKNMYSIHNDFFKKDGTQEINDDKDNYEDGDDDDDDDEGENEDGDDVDENSDSEKVTYKTFNDQDLIIKISNNNNNDNAIVGGGGGQKNGTKNRKSNKNGQSTKAEKRKCQQFVDKEHFIPYKPKNFQTEKALGVNSNFNHDVSNATLDLMGDDAADLHRSLQKTKWDRKKKKFVSVQSTLDQKKKIKTESGSYINASYKSNLYVKWLKNGNTGDNDNNNDDDNNNNNGQNREKKNEKYFGPNKRYFGSHKYKSTGRPGVKRFKPSNKENDDSGARGGRRSKYGMRQDQQMNGNDSKKRKYSSTNSYEKNGSNKKFKSSFSDDSSSRFKPKGNKRFSVGLKNKDQILKERRRKAKVQGFQNKRKKQNSKSSFKNKK